MCGIAGIYNFNLDKIDDKKLRDVGKRIQHRGPDKEGIYIDLNASFGLVHRRLSIIDLSETGNQPMISNCGRWVLCLNGEIYNYKIIREKLDDNFSINWSGTSDTEVLLNSLIFNGIDKTLEEVSGMFAFALWDAKTKDLFIARDRMGEKPLYFSHDSTKFIFGSELSCLEGFLDGNIPEIDRSSLHQLIKKGFIPAPKTIYKNISKLEPGSLLKINKNEINLKKYWAIERRRNRENHSYKQSIDHLEKLISKSVKEQMLSSDVPIGAFLSGGIDSSMVVALMQKNSKTPVKTFSIGFNDDRYNEAIYAKEIANHLGTDHTEKYFSKDEIIAAVEMQNKIFSEPFCDSSQLPTFLVSKIARDKVTVCLSGDGGDELFNGYRRYFSSIRVWEKIRFIPITLRKLLAYVLKMIPISAFNIIGSFFGSPMLGDKIIKGSHSIAANNFLEFYDKFLMSHYHDTSKLVLGGKYGDTSHNFDITKIKNLDYFEQMSLIDQIDYLPNDILCKVDRCSMSVSLESRIPLLNNEIVNYANMMPTSFKINNQKPKSPLRDILSKYVPQNMFERPKKGFAVPLEHWLRNELKEWGDNLLDSQVLMKQGYLNSNEVRRLWEEHQSGKRNWSGVLWNIICFQNWLSERK